MVLLTIPDILSASSRSTRGKVQAIAKIVGKTLKIIPSTVISADMKVLEMMSVLCGPCHMYNSSLEVHLHEFGLILQYHCLTLGYTNWNKE